MIALYSEIIAAAHHRDPELLVKTVLSRLCKGPDLTQFRDKDYLIRLGRSAGLRYHNSSKFQSPSIVAHDESGQFSVTILTPQPIANLPLFTHAHLLGHYFCHLQSKIAQGGQTRCGYREAIDPLQRYLTAPDRQTGKLDEEAQADAFAAALLMPQDWIRTDLSQGLNLVQIATRLHLSQELLSKRAQILGLIPGQVAPQSFLEAEETLHAKQKERLVEYTKRMGPTPGASSGDTLGPKTQDIPAEPNRKGMARLREIAAKLDNFPQKR
jgi:hypothetical protein